MKKEELRIVFMGTPDFAVESLKRLVEENYNIVGVVTMPDKPIGRHQTELQASPVKQYAVEHGLNVLQPEKLKSDDFVEALRALQADLQIVVAFRMLPEVVWNMPRLGTFNLHASLLPQYRGAAPINWAIINGDKETGITTFFLQHEIDTGRVIQRVAIPIEEEDNAGSIHDKLMLLGGDLVVETVQNILASNVCAIPQEDMLTDEPLRPAPKIFKDTCRICWQQSCRKVYDFIRGLSPYPAAWTELVNGDKTVVMKIYDAKMELAKHNHRVGKVLVDHAVGVKVAVEDGFILLHNVQIAGKKRMSIADFLRGYRFSEEAFMQ